MITEQEKKSYKKHWMPFAGGWRGEAWSLICQITGDAPGQEQTQAPVQK
jgi:hypothetical protein